MPTLWKRKKNGMPSGKMKGGFEGGCPFKGGKDHMQILGVQRTEHEEVVIDRDTVTDSKCPYKGKKGGDSTECPYKNSKTTKDFHENHAEILSVKRTEHEETVIESVKANYKDRVKQYTKDSMKNPHGSKSGGDISKCPYHQKQAKKVEVTDEPAVGEDIRDEL
ncbi:hypothetical protein BC833DRAFT_597562 [Globomyces pollinis-pini]|nr:hypothetical protein BC833DRAFT_597562 [Globomyces pollinis-pini]